MCLTIATDHRDNPYISKKIVLIIDFVGHVNEQTRIIYLNGIFTRKNKLFEIR